MPCSSMVIVCSCTLIMQKGPGLRGINLLYAPKARRKRRGSLVAVSGKCSIKTKSCGLNVGILHTRRLESSLSRCCDFSN